jgi:hypothetical protein
MGQVEHLADLAVAQPFGGHLDDLQFLWGELIPRLGDPRPARLSGRAELLACPLGPRDHAESVERLTGGAQRCP